MAKSNDPLTQVLVQLIQQTAASNLPTPSHTSAFAQDLLRFNAAGVKPFTSVRNQGEAKEQPSVLSRIFDLMSRPLYGVANYTKYFLENPNDSDLNLGEFWEGFSGKEKTMGSDVLEAAGMKEGGGRAALGFGLDIALDPTTYLGAGLAKNVLGRGAKATTAALGELEQESTKLSGGMLNRILQDQGPTPQGPRPVAAPAKPLAPNIRAERHDSSVLHEPVKTVRTEGDVGEMTLRARLEELLDSEMVAGNKATVAMISKTLGNMKKKLSEDPQDFSKVGKTSAERTEKHLDEFLREELEAQTSPPIRNILKAQQKDLAKNKMLRDEKRLADEGIISADELLEGAKKSGNESIPPDIPVPPLSSTNTVAVAEETAKALMKNKADEISLTQQRKIADSLNMNKSFANVSRPVFIAAVRTVEDNLIKAGKKFVDDDGNHMRLSDLLAAGDTPQAYQIVKAESATDVAQRIVDPALSTVVQVAAPLNKTLPAARAKQNMKDLSDAMGEIVKQAGGASKTVEGTKAFLRDLFDINKDAAKTSMERHARDYYRWVATGDKNMDAYVDFNKAIYKVFNADPRKLASKIRENQAVAGVMMKYATWWGAENLRPWAREFIDTMLINASAFEKMWQPVFRKTTIEQRKSAWLVATGKLPASNPQEVELARLFQGQMERLVSSSGIRDRYAPGASVVTRAGVTMREVNDALKTGGSDLRFTNKEVNGIDYSIDADWLKSWESWDVNDPIEAMYEVVRATQMVTRKHAMLDDAFARWGSPKRQGDYTGEITESGGERLQGTYFPPEIAKELNNVLKRFGSDEFKSIKGLETYDKVLRAWKSGVTIYSPSHHIRNIIGDMFLASMDGVVSPKPYNQAMRIMWAMKGKYSDILSPDDILDPTLRSRVMTRPGQTILTMKNGQQFTAEQLYVQMYNQGILTQISPGIINKVGGDYAEELAGKKLVPQIFGGKVAGGAYAISETRDHLVRMAHFIDVLSKTKQKSTKLAIEEAANRVKKWHPDGMDLTGFEKNIMRRIIPFYSWIRKSSPLVIEGMLMRPHLTMVYPKGMHAIQEAMGIEGVSGLGDPFPADQMFPDWIRERGIGPIASPPGAGGLSDIISMFSRQESYKGEEPGYTLVNPGNPMVDQIAQFSNPGKGILSALTPAINVPYSLFSGETSLGIPIENEAAFLAEQVPPVGLGARLTGVGRAIEGREEPWTPEATTNWATALGIRGTGPYRRQALYELQQRLRKAAIESGNL